MILTHHKTNNSPKNMRWLHLKHTHLELIFILSRSQRWYRINFIEIVGWSKWIKVVFNYQNTLTQWQINEENLFLIGIKWRWKAQHCECPAYRGTHALAYTHLLHVRNGNRKHSADEISYSECSHVWTFVAAAIAAGVAFAKSISGCKVPTGINYS